MWSATLLLSCSGFKTLPLCNSTDDGVICRKEEISPTDLLQCWRIVTAPHFFNSVAMGLKTPEFKDKEVQPNISVHTVYILCTAAWIYSKDFDLLNLRRVLTRIVDWSTDLLVSGQTAWPLGLQKLNIVVCNWIDRYPGKKACWQDQYVPCNI